jgi:aconitate hydratase
VTDRVAVACAAGEWGGAAALFPADEVTRSWLAARGRASDWRKSEGGEGGGDAWLEVDLGAIEPRFADLGRPESARPLPAAGGPEVRRVVIGPAAEAAELARLSQWLRGRDLASGIVLTILPGSRRRLEAAQRDGGLQELVAQGARIEADPAAPAIAEPGAGLCYGARPADLDTTRTHWWTASLEGCAAAAVTGRLTDPRRVLLGESAAGEPDLLATGESALLEPRAGGAGVAEDSGLPGLPTGEPLVGPVRGPVLLRCGDGVTVDQVLPWGARIAPLAGDIAALRHHAFAPLDPEFARRALERGGGFVIAGEDMGRGPAREQAALALKALGIRAVIARSWEPGFRKRLVECGVLPLTFARATDLEAVAPGDELELPTLPHGLEPGRPLVVRNLTRGTQMDVRHDLDARAVAIARGGGLLRYAAAFLPEN